MSTPASSPEFTITEARLYAAAVLSALEHPLLDAEVLLEYVLKRSRTFIYSHPEYVLHTLQENEYRSLVSRRAQYEPIAYITGEKEFYGRPFVVDKRVLVPRPETELLVQEALRVCSKNAVTEVYDVGTGSGCIAVTIAIHCPTVHVTGYDTSPGALKVAKCNVNRYTLNKRVTLKKQLFYQHSLRGSLIVANLPYLNDDEMASLPPDVSRYEPHEALRGGTDGFAHYRMLIDTITEATDTPIAFIFEISPSQAHIARAVCAQKFPEAHCTVLQDLSLRERIVVVEW